MIHTAYRSPLCSVTWQGRQEVSPGIKKARTAQRFRDTYIQPDRDAGRSTEDGEKGPTASEPRCATPTPNGQSQQPLEKRDTLTDFKGGAQGWLFHQKL